MGGARPLSQQELIPQHESEDPDPHVHPPQETPQNAPHAARSGDEGSRSSTDSPSVGSTGDSGEPQTEETLDDEVEDPSPVKARPGPEQ